MKYCPLRNYHLSDPQECLGEQCALAADGAGQCLIQQALQIFVSKERTQMAEEQERLKHETDLAQKYWAMQKNGVRGIPDFFTEEGNKEPVKLRHGGVYEDLTSLRDNNTSTELPLIYNSTTAEGI